MIRVEIDVSTVPPNDIKGVALWLAEIGGSDIVVHRLLIEEDDAA